MSRRLGIPFFNQISLMAKACGPEQRSFLNCSSPNSAEISVSEISVAGFNETPPFISEATEAVVGQVAARQGAQAAVRHITTALLNKTSSGC
jgi:hypothetical protein